MQNLPSRAARLTLMGLILIALGQVCFQQVPAASAATASGKHSLWVLAYYPTWQEAYLPPDKIDFTALTHIAQFAVIPKADGSLDTIVGRTVTPSDSQGLVPRAHTEGCKVLITVGGDGTLDVMRAAISDPVRDKFINNLMQFVTSRHYDGIDVDMEPLRDQDAANYEMFVRALRSKMNSVNPHLLLTAAVALSPAVFGSLESQFDRINIMTYDLAGPWQGFNTWFDAPLFGSGDQTMPRGVPYPSVSALVKAFTDAGVPKSKIGIGVAFYGYVWSGATGPRQSIAGVTATQPAYHDIMDQFYQPALYHWDDQAHAPYLSIDGPTQGSRKFISYDDERLCAEKVVYAREQGLGGVMIWELGDGYRANQAPGKKDTLLQAVKHAWLSPLPVARHSEQGVRESRN